MNIHRLVDPLIYLLVVLLCLAILLLVNTAPPALMDVGAVYQGF
jgi:hypothetical protein